MNTKKSCGGVSGRQVDVSVVLVSGGGGGGHNPLTPLQWGYLITIVFTSHHVLSHHVLRVHM